MSGQDIFTAAAQVEAFCRGRGWQFCFIGGLAVQRWGPGRFTQDVDLTVRADFGAEGPFVDAFLAAFSPRMPNGRQFAMERRVVLVRTAGGVDVDVALGALPFEAAAIARSSLWQVEPGTEITTCCAEDLVVYKVFAGRPRDWSDVEGIIARQGRALALPEVYQELAGLLELKEDVESLARLERLVAAVRRRGGW